MVFPYDMNALLAVEGIQGIQSKAHDIPKRLLQDWFICMDGILDIHRSNFVFRSPTQAELEEHKILLKESIRTCHLMNALVADPDFNEPELAARLQVRIRQLQDAYDTFHATLSDEQAERILQEVFPE